MVVAFATSMRAKSLGKGREHRDPWYWGEEWLDVVDAVNSYWPTIDLLEVRCEDL